MVEGGPLSSPEFKQLAENFVLFCFIAHGPRDPEKPDLARRKQLIGYPSLAYLDSQGTVLVKVPFDRRSVKGIAATGDRAHAYLRLRAAAAKGDLAAKARLLRMQIEERQVDHAAAAEIRQQLGEIADTKLRATLDRLILDLEVSALLRTHGQKGRHKLGPEFLTMLRDGPRPSPRVSRGFWFAILEWAERKGDAKAFAEGLAGFRAALEITDPDAAWKAKLLRGYAARLEVLQGKKR